MSDGDDGNDPFADADVDGEIDPFDRLAVGTDGDPLERLEVGDFDEDAVWAKLSSNGGGIDGDAAGVDGDTARVDGDVDVAGGVGSRADREAATDRNEAIVRKQQYCERCEHFSAPPGLSCGNPGTEIRELVDMERFRVYDCPVVERRRSLGREE